MTNVITDKSTTTSTFGRGRDRRRHMKFCRRRLTSLRILSLLLHDGVVEGRRRFGTRDDIVVALAAAVVVFGEEERLEAGDGGVRRKAD